MKESKASRVTLRTVAEEASVSRSTVCLCLRNQAGPSEKTREKVLRVAQRLGYAPDAELNSLMVRIRDTRPKDCPPIAWLNTHAEEAAWQHYKFMAPYLEGVKERCHQLGYRLEEIWTRAPHTTAKRVSRLLYQRGIEGVIVGPPAEKIQLHWEKLAGVALGTELLKPRLHRVRPEAISNFLFALNELKRLGYRRIGVFLNSWIDHSSEHVHRGMVHYLTSTSPPGLFVPPLFYRHSKLTDPGLEKILLSWVRTHKPRVIVGQDNRMVRWLESAGIEVPQRVGVFHLAIDDDVLDWTGILSNKRQQGRAAAELVVSLIQNRQFGVPKTALDTTIRGVMQAGKTLELTRSPSGRSAFNV